jgi:cyclophilin family peptidyl-prolyl cis-trans isomerase
VHSPSFKSALLALCFAATGALAWAGAPVIDPPIPATGEPAKVAPLIPVGKTLLFPITATDPDGDPISYTVSSSNPDIMVRAKTGNPKLIMNVSHADGGAGDPPYTGSMEFMLLRDWLPVSSGFIAGFAQAGFYDNVAFHRLLDLGGGIGTTGFIFQGGDPLTLTYGGDDSQHVGSGGPGMTGNPPDSTTAWKFQNEFFRGTIFSGRGQLAMANSGTNIQGYSIVGGQLVVYDYLDSNGSQFFITDGEPRHLDFKHNTFGQLLRGWDVLPQIKATKTWSAAASIPSGKSATSPQKTLKITSTSVVPDESDAVLVFSAKARGTSLITVVATDATGATAKKTFTVEAVRDTSNCGPIIRRMDGVAAPKDQPAVFGLDVLDLEFDYLRIDHNMVPVSAAQSAKGSLLVSSGTVAEMQPNAGYVGLNKMGFDVYQWSVRAGGFLGLPVVSGQNKNPSDATVAYVATGDSLARGEGVNVDATPAVALANVIVAKLHDTDLAGKPGDFTAAVNWGDGTPRSVGTLALDTSKPGSNTYNVLGGHTYAKEGIYSVVVDFTGNKGMITSARSSAVVTAKAIRAAGGAVQLTTGRVVNRIIATFTDSAPAKATGYTARIDWGDGRSSAGVISYDASSGKFIVKGTHGYIDSEQFAVSVRVHKKTDGTNKANDAIAWSVLQPAFTAAPHLPPFPHPKLTIAWNSGPTKSQTGLPGPNYQVTYSGVFVIINSGNRNLGASKIRFWLSDDPVLNKTGVGADKNVPVNKLPELSIIPFPAGAGGSGQFTITMPKGQSVARKYLLSEADYSDPIANNDGTEKYIVTGPLPPTVLVTPTAGLQTTEAGGTATFTVQLDSPPATGTFNIASITAGNPTTINLTSAHGITSGTQVVIAGITGSAPADINGTYTATVIDTDTITIPIGTTTGGTGGTMQVVPTVTIPLESTLVSEGTPTAAVSISSITTGNPATINTALPHGLTTGDQVVISGITGNTPDITGAATATVVDADTFTIPTNVTVAGTGGRIQKAKGQLVFTAQNYNVPQTVLITGVDDTTKDGDKSYRIQLKAAVSPDPLYNGFVAGEVVVTNKDNEP